MSSPSVGNPSVGLPPELPRRLRELDLTLAPERAAVVDPLELAAYLEADGLNDETLRERYGAGGLFRAAELLYLQRGTGRSLDRPPAPRPPELPWGLALRGPLYLLPGVAGLLLVTALVSGPVGGQVAGAELGSAGLGNSGLGNSGLGAGASAAFAAAATYGWGHGMLVAGVRYAEPLGVPGRALRLTLALAAGAGALLGGVLAWGFGGLGALGLGALVGGAVGLAGGAGSVLLALGRTAAFALSFAAPLVLGALVWAVPALGGRGLGLLALVAVPLGAALHATRAPGTLAAWPPLPALRRGGRPALFGWAAALACLALSLRLGGAALLPLVLSAGLLEAGVWHAQARLQHAARVRQGWAAVRRRGQLTLPAAALAYALVLYGLTLALLAVPALGVAPQAALALPPLGAALLLGTWLANHGREPVLGALWLGTAALLLWPGAPPALIAALTLLITLSLTFLALRDLRSYR